MADTFRKYSYSFSGADARVYSYFEGFEEDIAPLDTVQTISLSIHESKGQARALGYRGTKGFSRGLRTIAGSLIMTVINDHPLRTLMDQFQLMSEKGGYSYPGWSIDRNDVGVGRALQFEYANRMACLLPQFSLIVNYVSEGGNFDYYDTEAQRNLNPPSSPFDVVNEAAADLQQGIVNFNGGLPVSGASLLIRNIEIMDSGIVTSTHDMVTEMTFSFLATDARPISRNLFKAGGSVPPIAPPPSEDKKLDQSLRDQLYDYIDPGHYQTPYGPGQPVSATNPWGTFDNPWGVLDSSVFTNLFDEE